MPNLRKNILQNWNVVVVDDDPASLEIASTLLSSFGANVYTGIDGAEGIDLMYQVKPHFVVCDLDMPRVDGWELIEQVKKDRAVAEIPVIALTAHSMVGDRQKAIMAGFHNYLTKPLTPATFVHDLLNLLVDVPSLAAQLD